MPGGALPYLAYTGMCRWTGYGFQGLESNWVYNLSIKRLEQCVFLDWKPFKESEDLQRAVYICNIIFFVNVYLHDLSVKNYLILYAKQNKSGSESSASCLKQGSEMSNFCLIKQGCGLKLSAAQLHPDFPWVPPRD